jgi:hypothetical protein
MADKLTALALQAIDADIAYWHRAYGSAATRGGALAAFGVYAGLKMARERIVATEVKG